MPPAPRVGPPPIRSDDPVRDSALGHQPELLDAFQRLYGTLWSRGVLDHPAKEMARLRNARVTDCGYCRNVRFATAREQGLSEEVVDLVRDDYPESGLAPRQKAILRYTDAFLGDPGGIDPELREEMLRHFRPEEIVELSAGLALFLGFSKIAVALGQAPASMPTTVVPTPSYPEPGGAAGSRSRR
jgi:AhpD family alkylhydroperoxidase